MKKSEFSYFRHVSFLLHCCTFLSAPFLYGRGAFFRWIGGGSPFQRETDLLSRFFYDVCFFSMSFASCMYAFWPDGCICCICCPLWFHGFMLSICAGLVFSFPTPSVMVLREILCNCLAERLCCKETMAMTTTWRRWRRWRGEDGDVTLGRKRCFLPNFEWYDLFLAAGHGFRADPHPLS